MPIFDNIAGVQRQVAKSYSNINGVYREDSKVFDNVGGVWRESHSSGILAKLIEVHSYWSSGGYSSDPLITTDATGLTVDYTGGSSTNSSGSASGSAIFSIALPSTYAFTASSDFYIDSVVASATLTTGVFFSSVYQLLAFSDQISRGGNIDYVAQSTSMYNKITYDTVGGSFSGTNATVPFSGMPFTTNLVYFGMEFYLGIRSHPQVMQETVHIPNGSIILAPNSLAIPVNFA